MLLHSLRSGLRQKLILFFIVTLDFMALGLILPTMMSVIAPTLDRLAYHPLDSVKYIGLIAALMPSAFIISPFIGFLSDIYGRKKLLIFCLVLSCMAYLLLLVKPEHNPVWILFLIFIFFSTRICVVPLAKASLADTTSGKPLAFWFGTLATGTFTAMISSHIANFQATQNPSYWLGQDMLRQYALYIECIALLSAFFLFGKETLRTKSSNPSISFEKFFISALSVITNRTTLFIFLLFFIFEFTWGVYSQFIFYYLAQTYQVNDLWIAHHRLIEHIFGIVVLLIIYPICLYCISSNKLLSFSLLLGFILLLILVLTPPGAGFIWALLLTIKLTIAISLPLYWYFLSASVNHRHQGLLMGCADIIWTYGWAVSGLLGEIIHINKVDFPLLLGGGLFFIQAVLLILFFKKMSFYYKRV